MLGVATVDAPGVWVGAPNKPPVPNEGVVVLAAEAPPVASPPNKLPPEAACDGAGVPNKDGVAAAVGAKREGATADVAGVENRDRPVEGAVAAGCGEQGAE